MIKKRITLPKLYPKQLKAFFHNERYGWIEGSTKSGKTVAAIVWLLKGALEAEDHEHLWWVSPSIQQSKIAFKRLKKTLKQSFPKNFYRVNHSERTIKFAHHGTITFQTGDDPDALYGEDVIQAVIDEASRVKEESFHAVRSTLTATQGPVRILGNVKNRSNWFYKGCRRAEQGLANHAYTMLTADDAVQAGVLPQSEIDDAREVLPKHVFDALYRCKPTDDGTNPFTIPAIEACEAAQMSSKEPVAYGLDLAKKHDWTVLIGLDQDGAVCRFHRWQKIKWPKQCEMLLELVDAPCLVDATGVGDPIFDFLNDESDLFEPLVFSNKAKQGLFEDLEIAIQMMQVAYPAESEITKELKHFEMTHRGRSVFYEAQAGLHDDCVCSLALAYRHLQGAARRAAQRTPAIEVPLRGIHRRSF